MTTLAEARDALIGALRTGWLDDSTSAPVPLLYDNVKGDPPEGEDAYGRALPFSRITMRHIVGGQTSMGSIGNRRFDSEGILTQQIFTAPGDGHTFGDELAQISKGILRALTSVSSVWLTNIEVIEIGITGTWFQVNVQATFHYEEVA